jgi:hypothetical protein
MKVYLRTTDSTWEDSDEETEFEDNSQGFDTSG